MKTLPSMLDAAEPSLPQGLRNMAAPSCKQMKIDTITSKDDDDNDDNDDDDDVRSDLYILQVYIVKKVMYLRDGDVGLEDVKRVSSVGRSR
ncbi:hypothetical protein Pcinc_029676 [Petrolisthes cinctipes]|uniref:Uncharacterized protein n=1 Tax=Petrolisthes cinctipes TaxID=88211 RepID=A0AAE1K5I9_PETCI|nr:hypothetical protein Pcinc_029676 [Petrolisthes cinctipes]